MEVGGTTPRMGNDSREGGGRERLEHVLEVELSLERKSRAKQDEYRTYSGENVRNIFSRQSRG